MRVITVINMMMIKFGIKFNEQEDLLPKFTKAKSYSDWKQNNKTKKIENTNKQTKQSIECHYQSANLTQGAIILVYRHVVLGLVDGPLGVVPVHAQHPISHCSFLLIFEIWNAPSCFSKQLPQVSVILKRNCPMVINFGRWFPKTEFVGDQLPTSFINNNTKFI